MKDNKGFTLVELLAVIAILGILGIIVLEAIESVNKGNKEKAEEIQRHSILSSAVSYVPTSNIKLPNISSGGRTHIYSTSTVSNSGNNISEVRVYLNYLVQEGILEENIENPLTGENINMDIAYVRILYITNLSDLDEDRRELGQFDGNYFYELSYGG